MIFHHFDVKRILLYVICCFRYILKIKFSLDVCALRNIQKINTNIFTRAVPVMTRIKSIAIFLMLIIFRGITLLVHSLWHSNKLILFASIRLIPDKLNLFSRLPIHTPIPFIFIAKKNHNSDFFTNH